MIYSIQLGLLADIKISGEKVFKKEVCPGLRAFSNQNKL